MRSPENQANFWNDEQDELLRQGAARVGVPLDDTAVERFRLFLQELLAWNSKHNLTAIREPREIVIRHFLDSLTCVAGYDFTQNRPVIDVGTGAGFPGLPLKIAFPALPMTLLDSSIKKIQFLQHLCPLLGFPEVDLVHARAEDFGHVGSYRQKFYLAVSRALAPLPTLLEFCLPFVTVGGYFLAQKNRDLGEEYGMGVRASPMVGGGSPEKIEVVTPEEDLARLLVRVRKEQPTPSAFPRRPGVPSRRPLGTVGSEPKVHPKYR